MSDPGCGSLLEMNATHDTDFADLLGVTPYVDRRMNKQQAAFVAAYTETGSATKAAAIAGYSRSRIPYAKSVRQALADALEDCGVTVRRTVAEVAKLAYHDPRKLFDKDGKLIELHKLDDETAAAVSSFEVAQSSDKTFSEVSKVKLVGRMDALNLMTKLQQLTTDKLEVSGPDGGAIQVEAGPNENVRRVAFMLEQAVRQMSNTAGSRTTAPAQHRGSNPPGE